MKSLSLLAAVLGVLALASADAGATTDSSSFHVSLRIAASCDVSTLDAGAGRERVAVQCASASVPYRLDAGAPVLANEAMLDQRDGQARMTLTF